MAIIAPIVKRPAELAAAGCATATVFVTYQLPWNSWLIMAALSGIAGGLLAEQLTQKGLED